MIFNKTTWDWDHPVAYPSDGLRYRWDEDVYKSDNTKGLVEIDPETGKDI